MAPNHSQDGNRHYTFSGYNPIRDCSVTDDPGPWGAATREEYFYDGQKLSRREWRPYGDLQSLNAQSTYSYDASGDLTQEVHVDYGSNITTTLSYNWTYQGGDSRLTDFTAASGVTTTLDYNSAGRIVRRYTSQGYSDYEHEDGTDWLVRETWHSAISPYRVFDLARYWYVKGRPSRVEVVTSAPSDLSDVWSYTAYYLQYNWQGDVATFVAPAGDGGTDVTLFDPWGNRDNGTSNP